MRSGKLITMGVWLMILFNLLLSFGAVWSLQRMDPEIKRIYQRNIVSLDACEKMLLVLTEPAIDRAAFSAALNIANSNITERGEQETIDRIKTLSATLDSGNIPQRRQITREIIKLTNYNKNAIMRSALQAQKLRQAGAWGIVFLTLFFFSTALFFKQHLRKILVDPVAEIAGVMEAYLHGDKFRRCNPVQVPPDMKKLFAAINKLLDDQRKKP